MRLVLAVPVFAGLALAGCNAGDEPRSQAEAEEVARQMVKPMPGLYRSTSRLVSFDVPGMPPAQAEQLRQMFSTTAQGREYCLTPEEAGQGMEGALKKLAEGKCSYDRFNADGEVLDAKLTCETGRDMKATIAMKGTMSADGSQMRMEVEQSMPGAPGGSSVKMVAEIASERIGECPRG
ncbi:MAG TPA: DUF3617 domain-containing protein [Novosphingobium sp.]|nr:DUF3617 domain-containing protein [Novosphingobium sp.]HMP55865.1 DUF3617 domain-containing protein [Novosphingobium sp.]